PPTDTGSAGATGAIASTGFAAAPGLLHQPRPPAQPPSPAAPEHRRRELKLGRGGTAALAVAQGVEADLGLMDEGKGSREAQSRVLRVADTINIYILVDFHYFVHTSDRRSDSTTEIGSLAY